MIEFIGKENVQLNSKQISEIIDLIDKEEILEVEEKIEKALQKEKETSQAAKQATPSVKVELKIDQQAVKSDTTDKAGQVCTKSPPKIDPQSPIVPPPYNSIDPNKKDNTKMF